jgi:ferrochelatase
MPEGSPLLVHTERFAAGLVNELAADAGEFVVEIGMRYGSPSISGALSKLKKAGVDRIVAAPLYPQYTQSSFETAVAETRKQAKKVGIADKIVFLEPFYVEPGFIQANAAIVGEHLKTHSADYVLFSYHGVPVRHIKQVDTNDYCRINDTCCADVSSANANCYRAQCHATTRAIAAALELKAAQHTTCFQSQFGRDEWIGPSFEDLLVELPKRGIKTVAVACPSFVADCLETLEEIGIRGTRRIQRSRRRRADVNSLPQQRSALDQSGGKPHSRGCGCDRERSGIECGSGIPTMTSRARRIATPSVSAHASS